LIIFIEVIYYFLQGMQFDYVLILIIVRVRLLCWGLM